MNDSDESALIDPPSKLAAKVQKKAGKDLDDLLANADAEVAKLSSSYTEWVQEDLVNLANALSQARADAPHRKNHLEELYTIAHDMKGQGGTFGYNLITSIGASLCRFVERLEDAGDRDLEIVSAHIEAMKVVIRQQVQGDGGDIGRKIVVGLERAVVAAQKK